MELTHIKARDLDEAWFLCVKEAYLNGREYIIDKGSFEGTKRKEIPLVCVQVAFPWTRPLSPTVPTGIPSVATEEDIQQYLLYLMTSEKKPGEHYTYGEDLAPQIPEVINRYKEWGHNTNRLCMSVGSKESLFLYRQEDKIKTASSQCLRLVDTRIQDGALHFIVYFRSWDLFAGFPVNMGGLQLLKEYMAGEIGVNDGTLTAFSKGLHLYEHTFELAKALLRMKENLEGVEVGRAVRSFGTDRVMIYDRNDSIILEVSGALYKDVVQLILERSNPETEFIHRIPNSDPNLPVETKIVKKEEW